MAEIGTHTYTDHFNTRRREGGEGGDDTDLVRLSFSLTAKPRPSAACSVPDEPKNRELTLRPNPEKNP